RDEVLVVMGNEARRSAWNGSFLIGASGAREAVGRVAAAFLVGAVWLNRTAIAATRAAARDDDAEARRQLRHWSWGYRLVVVLLVLAAWDMTTNRVSEREGDERQRAQCAAAPQTERRPSRRRRVGRRRTGAAPPSLLPRDL